MPDGTELTFPRASEQSPDTVPGDVILTLRQQAHSRFKYSHYHPLVISPLPMITMGVVSINRRKGHDLHYEHTISLKEALLGFRHSVQHLDGRQVELKSDAVTPPG
jgi:DnaJ-class molecular chaperone